MQIRHYEQTRQKHAAKIARLKLSGPQKRDLQEILEKAVAYVPDDRFRRPTVMLPVMQRDVKITPGLVLDSEDERTLFLQLNYARYKMGQVRRHLLRRAKWGKTRVLELLNWNKIQLEIRTKIITGNMGLALAMAKHANYYGIEFTELVSEGNIALLCAAEKFDCGRGFKFSTYACRAILKSFSRIAKQNYRYRNFFSAQWEPSMEKGDRLENSRETVHQDWTREVCNIFQSNLADLSATEHAVVEMRFPLNGKYPRNLTLKEVGEKLSLSKERIRQIQNQALVKLREATERRMAAV